MHHWNNMSRISQLSVFAVVLLGIGLVGAVWVAQQGQDSRSKAAIVNGTYPGTLNESNDVISGGVNGDVVGSNNVISGDVTGCVQGNSNVIGGRVTGRNYGRGNIIARGSGNGPCVGQTAPTVVPPTAIPTIIPTRAPTATPVPTVIPTRTPTGVPTVTIIPTAFPTTVLPTATKIPTPTPTTATIVPTATIAPTCAPTSGSTIVAVTLLLHGLGNGGDSVIPGSAGNFTLVHPQRTVVMDIYDSQNQLVVSKTGTVTFNATAGNFTGTVDVGTSFASGSYTIKIKSNQYLRGLVPGIQTITAGTTNSLPALTLITGDINNDNQINIVDYNIVIGCYSDLLPPVSCPAGDDVAADVTDDGHVNQFDYNLFIRELTNLGGQ